MRPLLFCMLLPACDPGKNDTGRAPIPRDERPPLEDDGEDDDDSGGVADDSGQDDEPDPAEACHPDVAGWPEDWAATEDKVLDKVNQERAAGADCGSYGSYAPAGPLEMDPDLRCAARYHSLWMAENDSMTHESPGGDLGDDPWSRIAATDFAGTAIGENIAGGYSTAGSVVQGWMASDGHCANIMAPSATLTGIGLYVGGSWGYWWTENFGA